MPVENDDRVAGLNPEDLREVASLVAGEGGIFLPGFGW
jgi:hypothetical protein